MASCPIPISNFEFAHEEIEEAIRDGRLLSMEIEFSRRCNFHCPYCYVPQDPVLENELSREEIRDVIQQAKNLGAKKIIILGGEPTIYPHILEKVDIHTRYHHWDLLSQATGWTNETHSIIEGECTKNDIGFYSACEYCGLSELLTEGE